MKIVIINCHWNNRGDEAAIRSMIDELQDRIPGLKIYVQKGLGKFDSFPDYNSNSVEILPTFPIGGKKRYLIEKLAEITKGKIALTEESKVFYAVLKNADLVIHAPGGPSIGDIYLNQEKLKLRRLKIIMKYGVPYVFYAPSMGPFENKKRNPDRRKVIKNASLICLREEISKKYVKEFVPESEPIVTLDSAFQHSINLVDNEKKYKSYIELSSFIGDGNNVIGVTITDLKWNSLYNSDDTTSEMIRETFTRFIKYLSELGYKILFIPQLFGKSNDYNYMKTFETSNCYVMSDLFDCYFQQYVISKLLAVVGMRYHSNIFSAKMGIPFISVSYEQKMEGFMKISGLSEYCISIKELSFDILKNCFERLIINYDEYKTYLEASKIKFQKKAMITTDMVCDIIYKKEN